MKIKDIFLIDFKNEKLSLALVIWLFSFLLHNTFFVRSPAVSAIFYVIILFIIPLYIITAIVYSIIKSKRSRKPKEKAKKKSKKTKNKNKNKKSRK